MKERELIENAEKSLESNLNVIFMFDLADFKGIINEYEIDKLFDFRFKLESISNQLKYKLRQLKIETRKDKVDKSKVEFIENEIKQFSLKLKNTIDRNEENRRLIVNDCIVRLREFQKRKDIPHSVRRINIEGLRNIDGF